MFLFQSLNGVFVNDTSLPKNEKRELDVNDVIRFGQPDTFTYQFREKIMSKHLPSTSREAKRLKTHDSR